MAGISTYFTQQKEIYIEFLFFQYFDIDFFENSICQWAF